MHSKHIGSYHSRSINAATVMVSWSKDLFCSSMASEDRPARINHFAEHNVIVNGKLFSHILFSASWFKHYPDRNYFSQPVTVWECDIFEVFGCLDYSSSVNKIKNCILSLQVEWRVGVACRPMYRFLISYLCCSVIFMSLNFCGWQLWYNQAGACFVLSFNFKDSSIQ